MKLFPVLAAMGLLGVLGIARADQSSIPNGRIPVLVELFTSEGCSSCPPADDALARLQKTQPISGAEVIALGEHVDYWNGSDWTDPFSTHAFSVRQNGYAQFFRRENVYTPQMIVDGRVEFVGSDGDRARQAIAQAARVSKIAVQIMPDKGGAGLSVRIGSLPDGTKEPADVVLAITEDGLRSQVAGGENGGRTLAHTAVVRHMSLLGTAEGAGEVFHPKIALDSKWRRNQLRAVVFVQERGSRRILGVGQARLG